MASATPAMLTSTTDDGSASWSARLTTLAAGTSTMGYYRFYNMDPGEAQREISARFDDEAEEAVQASKPTQPEQTNIPFERYHDEDENNDLPF